LGQRVDAKATIRIVTLRDEAIVSVVYRASRFGKVRRFRRADDAE
jgi:hypothetical protein